MSEESDYVSIDKDDDTTEERTPRIEKKDRRKSKSKKDKRDIASRFQAEGVNFKAKIIGIETVPEPRGDKMCQDALLKAKISAKSAGTHKQRITINVSLDGLKILDDKKPSSTLHHHSVHRISFISRDVGDNRAFGYVYGCGDGIYQFFAIKTEKPAEGLVWTLRDLFQVVFEKKKEEAEKLKEKQTEGYKDSTIYQPSIVNLINEHKKDADDSPGQVERKREDSFTRYKSGSYRPLKGISQITSYTKSCDDLENWAVPWENKGSSSNAQFPVTFDNSPVSNNEDNFFDPKNISASTDEFKSATSVTKSLDDLNCSVDIDPFLSFPNGDDFSEQTINQINGNESNSCDRLSDQMYPLNNEAFNNSFTSDTAMQQIDDPFQADPFFNKNASFTASSQISSISNSPAPVTKLTSNSPLMSTISTDVIYSQIQSSPYLKRAQENSFFNKNVSSQSFFNNSFELSSCNSTISDKFQFCVDESESNVSGDKYFGSDPFEQAPFTIGQHNKHKDKSILNTPSPYLSRNTLSVDRDKVDQDDNNSSMESLDEFSMPSPIVPPPPLPTSVVKVIENVKNVSSSEVSYQSPDLRNKFSKSYTIDTGSLVVNLPPAIPPRNSNRTPLISQSSFGCNTPPPTPPRPDKSASSTRTSSYSSVTNMDEFVFPSDSDSGNSKIPKKIKEKSHSPIAIPRPRPRNHSSSISPALKVSSVNSSPANNQDTNLFFRDTVNRSSDKCDDQIAARRISSNKPTMCRKNSVPNSNMSFESHHKPQKEPPKAEVKVSKINPRNAYQANSSLSNSSFNSNFDDPFKEDPFTNLNDSMQKSVNDFSTEFPNQSVEFSTKAVTLDENVFVDIDPFKDDPFFQKKTDSEMKPREKKQANGHINENFTKDSNASPKNKILPNMQCDRNNSSISPHKFDFKSNDFDINLSLKVENNNISQNLSNTERNYNIPSQVENATVHELKRYDTKATEYSYSKSFDTPPPVRPGTLDHNYRYQKSKEIKSDSSMPSFFNPFSVFTAELQSPDPFDTRFAKSICDQAELHVESVNLSSEKDKRESNCHYDINKINSDSSSFSNEKSKTELPNPFLYAMKNDCITNSGQYTNYDKVTDAFTYNKYISNSQNASVNHHSQLHLNSSDFLHSSPLTSRHLWTNRHEQLPSNNDEIYIRNSYESSDC